MPVSWHGRPALLHMRRGQRGARLQKVSRLTISLLPGFAVAVDGQPVTRFRSLRTRGLLAFLAADPVPHQRARVAGLLWPDQADGRALHNLSQTLHQLRDSLGSDVAEACLWVDRTTIRLGGGGCDVDAALLAGHLERAREAASSGRESEAAAAAAQALDTYGGPLLQGFAVPGSDLFDEWLARARADLHNAVLSTTSLLVAHHERSGDLQRAVGVARRWADLEPLDEAALRTVVRLLASTAGRAAALDRYERATAVLTAELGVALSPLTRRLGKRLRESAPPATRPVTAPRPAPPAPRSLTPVTGPNRTPAHMPDHGEVVGRERELRELQRWRAQGARLVGLWGLGGVGKSTLAAAAAARMEAVVDATAWRSLYNAPTVRHTVEACMQALAPDLFRPPGGDATLEGRLDALLDIMRRRRCLIVLDDIESLLSPGPRDGGWQAGHEGYGALLRRVTLSPHESTVLLAGREEPPEVARLRDYSAEVQTLWLAGLPVEAGVELLAAQGIAPSPPLPASTVVRHYSGNPLALKLVASSIRELYASDVSAFLAEGTPIFGGLREVLSEQVARLSSLERHILTTLALEREPVTLEHLRTHISAGEGTATVLDAIQRLRRRCLLEPADGRLTLQSVVMEYVAELHITNVVEELDALVTTSFGRHALVCSRAPEHARQDQHRQTARRVATRLADRLGEARAVERLRSLPDVARQQAGAPQPCLAGNVVNVLTALGADLSALDLHQLPLRHADLRARRAWDADLSGCDLTGALFTGDMAARTCLAASSDRVVVAVGATDGTTRVRRVSDGSLVHRDQVHQSSVLTAAFAPDGDVLATGAMDGVLVLRAVGAPAADVRVTAHQGGVLAVVFTGDGMVATSGYDGWIRLWDVATGGPVLAWPSAGGVSFDLAAHSHRAVLLSADEDGGVRRWNLRGQLQATMGNHADRALCVSLSPDGLLAASGGFDHAVRIWDVETGHCLGVLGGHRHTVSAVAFSPDGSLLASAGWDEVVRLWRLPSAAPAGLLGGHGSYVSGVAFSADGESVTSSGFDQSLRTWDVRTGSAGVIRRGHTS